MSHRHLSKVIVFALDLSKRRHTRGGAAARLAERMISRAGGDDLPELLQYVMPGDRGARRWRQVGRVRELEPGKATNLTLPARRDGEGDKVYTAAAGVEARLMGNSTDGEVRGVSGTANASVALGEGTPVGGENRSLGGPRSGLQRGITVGERPWFGRRATGLASAFTARAAVLAAWSPRGPQVNPL